MVKVTYNKVKVVRWSFLPAEGSTNGVFIIHNVMAHKTGRFYHVCIEFKEYAKGVCKMLVSLLSGDQ